ncbi:hypothetical protein EK904_007339 [Melospiza melodia maxima]|nr:hypothetical protein EK904_007339 [Melospiza melodia maxima]
MMLISHTQETKCVYGVWLNVSSSPSFAKLLVSIPGQNGLPRGLFSSSDFKGCSLNAAEVLEKKGKKYFIDGLTDGFWDDTGLACSRRAGREMPACAGSHDGEAGGVTAQR